MYVDQKSEFRGKIATDASPASCCGRLLVRTQLLGTVARGLVWISEEPLRQE
jgi:hypothetical protein